jgi:flavodoxin
MKALVLYSSQTGRTKKFAEAIRSVLPKNTDFLPMEQAPEHFDDYDIVFAGIWFLDYKLDSVSQSVLQRLNAKKVAIFATMHRDLYSDEISKNLRQAVDLLPMYGLPVRTSATLMNPSPERPWANKNRSVWIHSRTLQPIPMNGF